MSASAGPARATASHEAIVFAIKAVHSLAFFVIRSCILDLVYAGVRLRSGRRAALAAGIALDEAAVHGANGFRCPLAGLAARYGAESGRVTDVVLPRWLAANSARISTPLLLGLLLQPRNLRRTRAVVEP